MKKYRFTNGLIISDGKICDNDVLIIGEKIEAVIPRNTQVSSDYEVIDCTDKYISSGFVDIHQHGGGGADYMDDDEDTFVKATTAHLMHGTTSIMPTTLSADKESMIRAVKNYYKQRSAPK